MKVRKLFLAGCFMASALVVQQASAQWVLFDNFAGDTPGTVLNGLGAASGTGATGSGWHGSASGILVSNQQSVGIANFGGGVNYAQVSNTAASGTYNYEGGLGITAASTAATVFCQFSLPGIYASGGAQSGAVATNNVTSFSIGVTTNSAPASANGSPALSAVLNYDNSGTGNGNGYFRIPGTNGNLQVATLAAPPNNYNAAGYTPLPGVVYNLWFVIDAATSSYAVFIADPLSAQNGDTLGATPVQLYPSSQTNDARSGFVNAPTNINRAVTLPLTNFVIGTTETSGSVPQGQVGNIYVDLTGSDLTDPTVATPPSLPILSSFQLVGVTNGGKALESLMFQGNPNHNQLSFVVTPPSGVTISSVSATLNATNLAGVVTSTNITGLPASGTVTIPLANDQQYGVVIAAALPGFTNIINAKFDTISDLYYTWEAVDFDFNSGQFFQSQVPWVPGSFPDAGAYYNTNSSTNSAGLGIYQAVTNIDANYNAPKGTANYRVATNGSATLSTGTATTGQGPGDVPRFQYPSLLQQTTDYEHGYVGNGVSGNEWENYTRVFNAGLYNIYARFGPNSSVANESAIYVVTNGWGTKVQGSNYIGTFSTTTGSGGGWSSYTWTPAKDSSGNLSVFAAAGDQETLKTVISNGAINDHFFMLVPASPIMTGNPTNIYAGAIPFAPLDIYGTTPSPAVQWYTDNGTAGATWSPIDTPSPFTTISTSASGPVQFYAAATVNSNNNVNAGPTTQETVTTAITTVNVLAGSQPFFMSNPPASVGVNLAFNPDTAAVIPATTTLTATFTGSLPITYQWYVAPVDGLGNVGAFSPVGSPATANTNTASLSLSYTTVQTNEYYLSTYNAVDTSSSPVLSATVTVTVNPAPILQVAGDLIVDLRSEDLYTGLSIWTNRSTSPNSVGNFTTSSSTTNKLNLITNGGLVALNVNNAIATSVVSSGKTPSEINANNPCSMEAWIYATSLANGLQAPMGYGNNGTGNLREFSYGGGAAWDAYTASGDGSDIKWGLTQTINGWHHLALTYDGTTVTVYQDGVVNPTTGTPTSAYTTPASPVTIGSSPSSNPWSLSGLSGAFPGYIAAARLESGVLTAAQVLANFQAGPLIANPVTPGAVTSTAAAAGTDYTVSETPVLNPNPNVTYTYQWYVVYPTASATPQAATSSGATWGAVSLQFGSTGSGSLLAGGTVTLSVHDASATPVNPALFQYYVVITANGSGTSVSATSPTLSQPVLVTSPVSGTSYFNVTGGAGTAYNLTATFTGTFPMGYQWYSAPVSGAGVVGAYTALGSVVAGDITGTATLTVTPSGLASTNAYYVVATNIVTVASASAAIQSASAQVIATHPFLQVAGDLVADLRAADLYTGLSVWTNRSSSANSVGNFTTASTPTNKLNLKTNAFTGIGNVTALFVNNSGAQAVESSGLVPTSLTAGAHTMEAWVYATTVPGGMGVALGYGVNSGNYNLADLGVGSGQAWDAYNGYNDSVEWGGSANVPPTANAWHYIVVTVTSGGAGTAYLDGAFNATGGGTTPHIIQTHVDVGIQINSGGTGASGIGNNGNVFQGYIAAARLEAGVLTASQVAENYAAGPLAATPVTVVVVTNSPANYGNPYTVSETPILDTNLSYTYQWYVTNGSGGATAINGSVTFPGYSATPITYTSATSPGGTTGTGSGTVTPGQTITLHASADAVANEVFGYYVVISSTTGGFTATSPTKVITIAPAIPPVFTGITASGNFPPGNNAAGYAWGPATDLNSNYLYYPSSFVAQAVGESPLTFEWFSSANPNAALPWTDTGISGATLTLANTAVGTTYYYAKGIDPAGSSTSYEQGPNTGGYGEIETNIVVAPPALPTVPVQYAGDVIVDLNSADLLTGATVWTNRALPPLGVGDFTNHAGGAMNSVSGASASGAFYSNNALGSLNVAASDANAICSSGNTPAEINGNNPCSMEAWIYCTALGAIQQDVIAYGTTASTGGVRNFGYGTSEGWAGWDAYTANSDNTDVNWTGSQALNTWHYIALTYDGSNIRIYQDGVSNNTSGVPTTAYVTPATSVILGEAWGGSIGNENGGAAFPGYIASARLESGILSAAQIATNFLAGPTGIIPVALGAPSATPTFTVNGTANVVVAGSTVTLGVAYEVTNASYPMSAWQWYTDSGTAGATWSLIAGATSQTYAFNSSVAGPVKFYVTATNDSSVNPAGGVSPATTVNVVALAAPTVQAGLTQNITTNVNVPVILGFNAAFTGSPPLTYQWQASSDGTTWTPISGANVPFNGELLTVSGVTNVSIAIPTAGTTYLELLAYNSAAPSGVASGVVTINASPASTVPMPQAGTVQVAGDLIVNLEPTSMGLTVWTNDTGSANGVGNFTNLAGTTLTVGTVPFVVANAGGSGQFITNVLNVGGIGNQAVQSSGLIPTEISGAGAKSFEAWVYLTNNPGNACAILSCGNNSGGNSLTALAYGPTSTGFGAFNAYNNSSTPWTTEPAINAWHYLVATLDGSGNVAVYADGQPDGTGTGGTSAIPITCVQVGAIASSGQSAVGNFDGTYTMPFRGYIAAARLESGVLTADQVANNFTAGPWGTVPANLLLSAAAPVLNAAITGTQITLTWTGGHLVSSTSVTGPWTAVQSSGVNVASGYVVPIVNGTPAMFYTLVSP
jgi:hypothetical protein